MTSRLTLLFLLFFLSANITIAQNDSYIKLDRKNRVKELGTIKNGEKDGLFFKYKRNGKHKSFIYENGKKRKVAPLEVSTDKSYNAAVTEVLEESYGLIKDEKREGMWLTFNAYNEFTQASLYKNGKLHGITYRFHVDGEVLGIDRYEKGIKNGICEEFHSGGALHYRTLYKNGKIVDGENIYYYPSGSKKFVDNYKNGLRFGMSTTYYESGAIEIEGIYREKGYKEGPWKEYFESGAIKEEYMYKHGLFHGEYTIYDEKGTILEQYIYKNDKLIKTIVD
ncbi:MAG: toxin-antitoxin system YwqK family antitoxin [Kordia sp.]|uniref:toxin-antitoxin system YwqK family antitoxin n=1 Tax=Kordia sp. TaxID=1965332 RepID=UPI003859092F